MVLGRRGRRKMWWKPVKEAWSVPATKRGPFIYRAVWPHPEGKYIYDLRVFPRIQTSVLWSWELESSKPTAFQLRARRRAPKRLPVFIVF